jgi:hypothetical protein
MAVPLFVQGHRAPLTTRAQAVEELVGTECVSGEGGHHRRREERTGQRDPAHLLEDDAHLQEPGPLAGNQHSRPAHGHPTVPLVGAEPGGIVGQLAYGVRPHLPHRPPGHVLQGELLDIEGEIHGGPPGGISDVGVV